MQDTEIAFSLKKAVVERNGIVLIVEFNWDVQRGESWLICGANGTGKTTLLEVLTGQQRLVGGEMILPGDLSIEKFSSSVALIRRDFSLYHLFGISASFYQQRYFSIGVEETPLVIDFIAAETEILKTNIRSAAQEFRFDTLLDKHIVSLSTGESRRILLLILWLTERKIICFDDPYSGLDPEGSRLVSHALRTLLKKNVTILVTGVETQAPDFIENVLYIKNQHIAYNGKADHFRSNGKKSEFLAEKLKIKKFVRDPCDNSFKVAAEMKNITIRYSEKIIQENFSWRINRGDKWMLTGANGSGKSTLMSLIYGDNPMAYAYELVVFDRIRGTGETIWDIKRRIGYFSSELQQFFPRSLTLYEAVLTGYSDHLRVRDDLTPGHYRQADEIIEAAGITTFKETPLYRLSFSKCRLALVCRALVKLPPVVILDEPCQGLDLSATETVNRLVDVVCGGELKTLIYVTHQTNDVPKIINRHLNLKKPKSH
jgi:molybdate transport system ATP-binding protein